MTSSRAEARHLLSVLGAAGLLVLAAPVLAQSGPRSLTPPGLGDPVDAAPAAPIVPPKGVPVPQTPRIAAPPPPAASQPGFLVAPTPSPAPTESGASVMPGNVDVAPMAAIDVDAAGTLSPEQGGFGTNMWNGTRRALVETLLPQLPTASTSSVIRGLMRRLLMTPATPPQGTATKSLIGLRVEALAQMGDVADVDTLMRAAGDRVDSPELAHAQVDLLFLNGDDAKACPIVAAQAANPDIYWRKALIFCQALAGDADRAQLSAQVLSEQGDKDTLFYDLLAALTGPYKPKFDAGAKLEPLHFAMARAAKLALPPELLTSNNPAILRLVATSPGLDIGVRLEAAERAESMGALDTQALRDLYSSVQVSKDQLEKPLSAAQADKSPMSRAILYRRASQEKVATAMAGVIQLALNTAENSGRYQSQARVYRDLIKGLPPSGDLVWFAPDAVRALLAANEDQLADTWFDILRGNAIMDDRAAVLRDRILPVARLAGGVPDEDWAEGQPAAWLDASFAAPDPKTPAPPRDEVRGKAALLFNLLEALGDPVAEEDWEKILAGPPLPGKSVANPAIRRQLETASGQQRVGETVLLASIVAGNGNLTDVDPAELRAVIEALRDVGLTAEAHDLAVEAALAAGI